MKTLFKFVFVNLCKPYCNLKGGCCMIDMYVD